jgi:beta-glucosidase/6-phospho-beta-glucosidase/beta-galactosidase
MKKSRVIHNSFAHAAQYYLDHKCEDIMVVVNRDATTTTTITGERKTQLVSLIHNAVKAHADVNKVCHVYYHKMSCLDTVVLGVLTGDKPFEEEVV